MKNCLLLITLLSGITVVSAQSVTDAGKEKTITIPATGVAIQGSLLSNSNKEKVVIIIAGSGPTDRNGNSIAGVNCDAYKLLATALVKNNISSFRYDKRGIAKSVVENFNETDLSFDDYINDAVTIYNYLKDSLGFKKIYFAGHSEGSLIGMIASAKTNAQGYISIAGAGRPINMIITEQVTRKSAAAGAVTDSLFTILKTKNKIDSVPPYLLSVFRPSVQPYMVSWMKYDPAAEIGKIKSPVLIVQGTCDIQVKVADAANLAKGNKKAKLILIERMTHVLKDADADCTDKDLSTYHNPSLPLDIKFVNEVISFIKSN